MKLQSLTTAELTRKGKRSDLPQYSKYLWQLLLLDFDPKKNYGTELIINFII